MQITGTQWGDGNCYCCNNWRQHCDPRDEAFLDIPVKRIWRTHGLLLRFRLGKSPVPLVWRLNLDIYRFYLRFYNMRGLRGRFVSTLTWDSLVSTRYVTDLSKVLYWDSICIATHAGQIADERDMRRGEFCVPIIESQKWCLLGTKKMIDGRTEQ